MRNEDRYSDSPDTRAAGSSPVQECGIDVCIVQAQREGRRPASEGNCPLRGGRETRQGKARPEEVQKKGEKGGREMKKEEEML